MKKTDYTFWEHIFILRKYVFISLFSVFASASAIHYFHKPIIEFLFAPLGDTKAVFLSPLDPFLFILKIDLFGGIIVAIPVILLCGLLFAAPAIKNTSLLLFATMFATAILLVMGAFVYTIFVLLPLTLGFLLSIEIPLTENMFTAQNYLNFIIMQLYMSIIVAFIPFTIVFATLLHILNPYKIGGKRGMLYIGFTVAIAFLTPTTDIYTLLMLLIPALLMFEIGIIVAKFIYTLRLKRKT